MTHPNSPSITSDERSAAARGSWWWSLAENPPCLPWCTVPHDVDEFRVAGAMDCYRFWRSSTDGHLLVDVGGYQAGDPETPFLLLPTEVSIDIAGRPESLDAREALELSRALAAAAAFVALVTA